MNENKEFKPYIPAEKVTAEMTVTSVIMGVILAIVFGAANAYLGLRVGMTVSASIPADLLAGSPFWQQNGMPGSWHNSKRDPLPGKVLHNPGHFS